MRTSLLVALLVAASSAAYAAAPAPRDPQGFWNKECDNDAMKLCKDKPVGTGLLIACMKQHEAELSPACAEGLKAMPAWACAADRTRVCGDVLKAKGDVGPCMKQHDAELSEPCRKIVRSTAQDDVCKADRASLCKDERNYRDCLKSHKDQLAAGCRDRLFPKPKPAPETKPSKTPSKK